MSDEQDSEKIILKRRLIQKIEFLPSIPAMLQRIIAITNDPNSSAKDLQETIIKDQSIAAALLKLANSAYYGYPREVEDIRQAVVIVGFKTVVSVAVCVSVFQSLHDTEEGQEFQVEEFWKHTFAAGEAAKLISQATGVENSSVAYIIGLLHDIGKVVLAHIFKDEFDNAVFDARALSKPLYECEQEVFGFDHQSAGGWLGERWKLPEAILAGIKFHHSVDICPEFYLDSALIAHAANHVAKAAKIGNSGDGKAHAVHNAVRKRLKLDDKSLLDIINHVKAKKEEIDTFLKAVK